MELRKSSLSGPRCGDTGRRHQELPARGVTRWDCDPAGPRRGRVPARGSPCPGAKLPAASPAPPRAGSRPGGRTGDPAGPGCPGCPRWRPRLRGGGVSPQPSPVVSPHSHPHTARGHCHSWGSCEGAGTCWGSPGKALQVRDGMWGLQARKCPPHPQPPAAETPKSSGFPPRAAQPGDSLLEGLVRHFGWEGRGLRPPQGGDTAPRMGLGPSLPAQALPETPDSERATGPADHLPNWPVSQLPSQLPGQLTH